MTKRNKIPFNKPYLSGKETDYIQEAIAKGQISGNGYFTQKCHAFFKEKYNFQKCLLTTSCTDALEMAAILLEIKEGDEVIIPSYTFVSTANAFVLRGAKIVFAECLSTHPCVDPDSISSLITERTKAIVVVHYAGVACDMDRIMQIANKQGIFVVEDAAQAINASYKGKCLGSFGHLATFSFHETKNIISGEGGMLVINDRQFDDRAEVIWEKGTNRAAFFRGEVDKYNWVDIGSSFLPSDLIAAFLYAQLENLEKIQHKRLEIWAKYDEGLKIFAKDNGIQLPYLPAYSTNNAHMYYLLCKDQEQRDELIQFLKERNILSVFHYQALHSSDFYKKNRKQKLLMINTNMYSSRLLRLPFFYELKVEEVIEVLQKY